MSDIIKNPGESAPGWMHTELGLQIANYDPARYAAAPIELANAIKCVYDYAKSDKPDAPNTPPVIDLTSPHSINSMMHHIIAHAATGDVRHGVSNTRVIPYWDRQAFIVGLAHVLPDNPQEQQERLEIVDGLCINVLRTLARHYVDRIGTNPELSAEEHHENIARIELALLQGKQSKEDPYVERLAALSVARRALDGDVDTQALRDMDRMHAIAKLKQLLWVVDQQRNQHIREHLAEETTRLVGHALGAGITEENLALDMGTDTGISEATHRPPYDIRPFRQLEHLGQDDFWIGQDQCHVIPIHDLLNSIRRAGSSLPDYEKDGRYRLPFTFGKNHVPTQVRRGITDLLIQ